MNAKKRTRTGCLTCRTRRVKCDEKKPQCQRCENANVECAGYSMKKQLQVRYPRRNSTATATTTTTTTTVTAPSQDRPLPQKVSIQAPIHRGGYPSHRDDGLPLVALPVNPNPSQRPHSRARDILGYHQYLYRTLSVLFPPKNFHFWRDYMCEAAWETEWVFDAIVALGTMHRATLLCSQVGQNDQDRGQDTKIVAIRTYIKALEGLSSNLTGNGGPTPLALGVLVLMAYIECFSGNLAAAIRHTQIIQHYSYKLQLDDGHQVKTFVVPIESSLRDLELICRLSRPFPTALEPSSPSNAEKSVVAVPSSFFDAAATCSSTMLQRLLEFSAADLDLKHITWCVYTAHLNTVTREKILAFLKALDEWKAINSSVFDTLANGHGLSDPAEYSDEALQNLSLTPPCNKKASLESCLALALYCFYKARLLWALALSGDEDGSIELAAYFHVYDVLRLAKTAAMASKKSSADIILPCESVKIGFTPLLYLVGRCCPKGSWVRWIVDELRMIGREGVFHSDAYATTLEILLHLQEQDSQEVNPVEDDNDKMFVPAHLRTIAVLIPDMDGQTFEAYYARPHASQFDEKRGYTILRTARWSRKINGLQPDIEDCEIYQTPFCRKWLLERPIVQKWLDWNFDTEFNLDQVLRDHINGNIHYLGLSENGSI